MKTRKIIKKRANKVTSKLNTFHFRLEEHNGERSYYYDFLIYAKDGDEASEIARNYASHFYPDPVSQDDDIENRWEFDCGAIAVEIDVLREMSESDYAAMFFNSPHILNPHSANVPKYVYIGG